MFGINNLFSSVTSFITTWLTGRQQKQKAKLEMQLAEMNNKARLLADKENNNHAWEMANLMDKDKWLRRISFAMFSSPFLVALISPEHVAIYFNTAIKSVPVWWQQTFMAITGGIWGLSSLKNIVPAVMDSIKNRVLPKPFKK